MNPYAAEALLLLFAPILISAFYFLGIDQVIFNRLQRGPKSEKRDTIVEPPSKENDAAQAWMKFIDSTDPIASITSLMDTAKNLNKEESAPLWEKSFEILQRIKRPQDRFEYLDKLINESPNNLLLLLLPFVKNNLTESQARERITRIYLRIPRADLALIFDEASDRGLGESLDVFFPVLSRLSETDQKRVLNTIISIRDPFSRNTELLRIASMPVVESVKSNAIQAVLTNLRSSKFRLPFERWMEFVTAIPFLPSQIGEISELVSGQVADRSERARILFQVAKRYFGKKPGDVLLLDAIRTSFLISDVNVQTQFLLSVVNFLPSSQRKNWLFHIMQISYDLGFRRKKELFSKFISYLDEETKKYFYEIAEDMELTIEGSTESFEE